MFTPTRLALGTNNRLHQGRIGLRLSLLLGGSVSVQSRDLVVGLSVRLGRLILRVATCIHSKRVIAILQVLSLQKDIRVADHI